MMGNAEGPGIFAINFSRRLRRSLNKTKYAHNTINNIRVVGDRYVNTDDTDFRSKLFILNIFLNLPLKSQFSFNTN